MRDEPIRPGYKRTEVGVIPEDWEVKRIGDITSSTAGGTPSTKVGTYWGGNIKWMSSGELHLKRVYDVEGRITEVGLENSSAKLVPPRCVLVGLAGQGKTRGTVAINMVQLSTNQSIAAILPSDYFVPEYLYFNLDSRYEELRSLSTGASGRGGLNLTILNSLMIPFPTLSEQHAIAEVLSDVDALLDALERLIAKKRAIKQGAMQALLTGRVRLPGFERQPGYKRTEVGVIPEDWEVKKLGKVMRIKHGRSQRGIADPDGAYPILATGGEIGRTNTPLFSSPSVLIGRKGTIDVPQYMDSPFWTVDTLFYSEISDNADAKFLFYKFLLIDWYSYNEASGVPSLNAKTIESIEVSLPRTKEEQTAIAEVLSDMDAEIEALERRRAKVRAIKQGMMQELLTGRVRLVPPQTQPQEAEA